MSKVMFIVPVPQAAANKNHVQGKDMNMRVVLTANSGHDYDKDISCYVRNLSIAYVFNSNSLTILRRFKELL